MPNTLTQTAFAKVVGLSRAGVAAVREGLPVDDHRARRRRHPAREADAVRHRRNTRVRFDPMIEASPASRHRRDTEGQVRSEQHLRDGAWTSRSPLPDDTLADCIGQTHAIEVEFSEYW